ncbi:MAG: tetratricopeptide repeat protein [Bryobacteraceae bacterium]|nr:tetratricopeptide repeat protein [Bryobacteraceae bacterium]
MAPFAALAALALAIWDPAAPAQFEPLFRQRWERTRTEEAARDYGLFLQRIGNREGAARMLRQSLELEETAETLAALAALVPPAEALAYLQRALAIRPSGDLLLAMAALLEARGDALAAEKRLREALALYEKELGPSHPTTAVALNDLGLTLENREDFQGAEPLYRRALAIQQKAFGSVHPEVGTTLNNLAGVVGASGRLAEAEPLYRRALSVLEQTVGPRHRRVAACAANLAALLAALERPKEAKALYARAASIFDEQGETDAARQAREASASLP